MDVAVLGMGRMGRALAARLLEGGHRVAVWNRSKGNAGEVVSAGAREAQSVDDAVDGVDVAVTILANDDAVRAVALGELRWSIGAKTIYVDCSTVSPKLSGELAETFPARFLAMPVVGSPAAVRAGQAVFLAGGNAGVVDRLRPVLSSLSDTVRRYDTAPLAISAKLATNLLLLSEVVALAESFAVGRSGGLSDDQLRDLLGTGPLVPPGLKNRFEGVLTGSQEGWWTTVLGAKDAGLGARHRPRGRRRAAGSPGGAAALRKSGGIGSGRCRHRHRDRALSQRGDGCPEVIFQGALTEQQVRRR